MNNSSIINVTFANRSRRTYWANKSTRVIVQTFLSMIIIQYNCPGSTLVQPSWLCQHPSLQSDNSIVPVLTSLIIKSCKNSVCVTSIPRNVQWTLNLVKNTVTSNLRNSQLVFPLSRLQHLDKGREMCVCVCVCARACACVCVCVTEGQTITESVPEAEPTTIPPISGSAGSNFQPVRILCIVVFSAPIYCNHTR